MINIPWGGLCYKRLLMVIANSPEIIQQKTNDLLRGFEFIRENMDEFLRLTKLDWTDSVQ